MHTLSNHAIIINLNMPRIHTKLNDCYKKVNEQIEERKREKTTKTETDTLQKKYISSIIVYSQIYTYILYGDHREGGYCCVHSGYLIFHPKRFVASAIAHIQSFNMFLFLSALSL